jgi:hypothetical protein
MPLWLWAMGGVALLYFLAGSPNPYKASTSQGDVRERTPEDWQALWTAADSLSTTPEVLGLILFEESGMDPGAKNTNGHPDDPSKWCVGLNQFCPGTFEHFYSGGQEDYLALSMAEQLPYITKFWATKPSSAMQSVRDLFWVNFLPASYVPNASPDTIVNDPTKMDAHYALVTVPASNPALFPNGMTTLTAGDLDDYLADQALAPGWQYALQQIAQNAPSGENA